MVNELIQTPPGIKVREAEYQTISILKNTPQNQTILNTYKNLESNKSTLQKVMKEQIVHYVTLWLLAWTLEEKN